MDTHGSHSAVTRSKICYSRIFHEYFYQNCSTRKSYQSVQFYPMSSYLQQNKRLVFKKDSMISRDTLLLRPSALFIGSSWGIYVQISSRVEIASSNSDEIVVYRRCWDGREWLGGALHPAFLVAVDKDLFPDAVI